MFYFQTFRIILDSSLVKKRVWFEGFFD